MLLLGEKRVPKRSKHVFWFAGHPRAAVRAVAARGRRDRHRPHRRHRDHPYRRLAALPRTSPVLRGRHGAGSHSRHRLQVGRPRGRGACGELDVGRDGGPHHPLARPAGFRPPLPSVNRSRRAGCDRRGRRCRCSHRTGRPSMSRASIKRRSDLDAVVSNGKRDGSGGARLSAVPAAAHLFDADQKELAEGVNEKPPRQSTLPLAARASPCLVAFESK